MKSETPMNTTAALALCEELESKLSKATPGEWRWVDPNPTKEAWTHDGPDLMAGDKTVILSWGYDNDGLDISDDDAAFIAHAHNNAAALIAAVRGMAEENEKLLKRCAAAEIDLYGQCDYCKYRKEFPCQEKKCGIYGEGGVRGWAWKYAEKD